MADTWIEGGNEVKEDTSASDAAAMAAEQAKVAPEIEAKKEAASEAVITEAPKEVIPEKYDFKLPEGMSLNEKAIEKFTPVAKELGFTQDKANKIVDVYTQIRADELKAQNEAWENQQKEWVNAAKSDKEYGGVNFEKNIKGANSVLSKFGGKPLIDALNQTGVANHPELVRFFYRISKAISEDSIVTGAGSKSAPKSQAERIFNKSLKGDK